MLHDAVVRHIRAALRPEWHPDRAGGHDDHGEPDLVVVADQVGRGRVERYAGHDVRSTRAGTSAEGAVRVLMPVSRQCRLVNRQRVTGVPGGGIYDGGDIGAWVHGHIAN